MYIPCTVHVYCQCTAAYFAWSSIASMGPDLMSMSGVCSWANCGTDSTGSTGGGGTARRYICGVCRGVTVNAVVGEQRGASTPQGVQQAPSAHACSHIQSGTIPHTNVRHMLYKIFIPGTGAAARCKTSLCTTICTKPHTNVKHLCVPGTGAGARCRPSLRGCPRCI
jgi:hypothetical protein